MTNNNGAKPAPKNPRAYAPRWVTYISAILDGLYDNTRSVAADSKTKMITLTCLKTLAKGNALSDPQKDAFIGNIQKRLGKDDFQWTAPIKLNRGQLVHARDLMARLEAGGPCMIDAASSQETTTNVMQLEERIAALEALVIKLMETSGVEIPPFLQHSCPNLAQSGIKQLNTNGFSSGTKRNETVRNHDVDMTCPSDGMTGARLQPASNDAEPSSYNQSEIDHEGEPAPRRRENRIVVSYFRPDRARAPSAKMEIDDEPYNLIFHTAEVAEDKLRSTCTAEWLDMYEHTYGHVLRAQSRGNPASDFRYVASPIYGAADPLGYKKPVANDCVAILDWGDDGQPQSVIILLGDNPTVVPLRPSKLTKANAPTYKGSLKLAA